ncbi:MAG: hypothetical protein OD815_001136 [Candidatus Alkanophagales archaeon MCA70_species_2]|nr:hypothetical protein [Candidatus Alkanophaga liquidiphilum]
MFIVVRGVGRRWRRGAGGGSATDVGLPGISSVAQAPPFQIPSMMPRAIVDKERCVGCGKCTEACVFNAIRIVGGKADVLSERCIGCGACARACPQGAIRVAAAVPASELDAIKMQLDAVAVRLEWMKQRIENLESRRDECGGCCENG